MKALDGGDERLSPQVMPENRAAAKGSRSEEAFERVLHGIDLDSHRGGRRGLRPANNGYSSATARLGGFLGKALRPRSNERADRSNRSARPISRLTVDRQPMARRWRALPSLRDHRRNPVSAMKRAADRDCVSIDRCRRASSDGSIRPSRATLSGWRPGSGRSSGSRYPRSAR